MSIDSRMVTVCSACKRACCWDGYFMCDDARTASTIQLSVGELKKLNLEHSDFYLHNRAKEERTK